MVNNVAGSSKRLKMSSFPYVAAATSDRDNENASPIAHTINENGSDNGASSKYELVVANIISADENVHLGNDIILKAKTDEITIATNRTLLSSSSEYFRAMFSDQFKESDQNEIELNDVDGVTLQQMIDFYDSGSLPLNNDNVENLMRSAHRFCFSKIVDACSKYLIEHLDMTNCFELYEFAELLDHKELKKTVTIYICQHFMEIRKVNEFKVISIDTFKGLLEMDELHVTSEEDIFHAVMIWINHDPTNRKKHFAALVTYVRLLQLDEQFIKDHVLQAAKDSDCKYLIDNILCWKTKRDFDLSSRVGKFEYVDRLVIVAKEQGLFEYYCPRTQQWKWWKTLDPSEQIDDLFVYKNFVYLIGGKTVRKLNVISMRIVEKYELKSARREARFIVYKKYLYVVGGFYSDRGAYNFTTEKYDLTNFECIEERPITNFTSDTLYTFAALHDNSIYLVSHKNCARLNLFTNEWTAFENVRCIFWAFSYCKSVATFNEQIYVFRRECHFRYFVSRYNPATDTWTKLNAFKTGEIYNEDVYLYVHENNLYAIATGLAETKYMLHKYCPESDAWMPVALCKSTVRYDNIFAITFPEDLVT